MTQTVYNFLTVDEINFLLSYYDNKPYTSEKTTEYQGHNIVKNRHKDSDYNLVDGPIYQLLHPKLEKLLGSHILDSGAVLESHYPYQPHIDSRKRFTDKFYQHNTDEKCVDTAVLISLNEDPSFKTIIFDYFSKSLDLTQVPELKNNNITASSVKDNIDLTHFTDQELKFVDNLKISNVYNWKVGGLVTWNRNQLHCSSNFYSSGLQKKALVFFF